MKLHTLMCYVEQLIPRCFYVFILSKSAARGTCTLHEISISNFVDYSDQLRYWDPGFQGHFG